MFLTVNQRRITIDKEGYLRELSDWDKDVAETIAGNENLSLTPEHWEIIELLRAFYQEFGISPAMRVLVKQVGRQLGAEKGSSIYLMKLFPPSPAKIASKIAGLPRPTNCL